MASNSILNDEYTRMIKRIYEDVENAKNMYNTLPHVIRHSVNEITQYNNTLGTSLMNALNGAKELMESYGIN